VLRAVRCQWSLPRAETALPAWLLPLCAAPFIGSFVGVLVRRLPAGRPVVLGRSCCEACGSNLAPWDLVPIASFLLLRGRCRQCRAPIAPAHVAIELAAVAIAAWAASVDADPAWLWADCTLGWTLLALGWIDWTHLRLPDVLTLPLLLAGLAATLWLDPAAVADHALAAAIGYGAFRLTALAYRAVRRRDGLGEGDAKLLGAAGAWVGLAGLSPVVLVAALTGLAIALLRSRRLRASTKVPFGTALAVGIWLVRLYG
jgi:leader peptidase (prepilin peptidase)/N-methyltransferase